MTANVTYRLSTAGTAPSTTTNKNGPLTNAEIDGNLKSILADLDLKATIADPAFTGFVKTGQTSSSGYGLWNDSAITYGILMSGADDATYGGRISGDTTSDYNMYFTMSGGTNRGFVFRSAYGTNIFSINPTTGVRTGVALTASSVNGITGLGSVAPAALAAAGTAGTATTVSRSDHVHIVGPFGTTADTFCAGNDSRLSDSRAASDVYAWAKASSNTSNAVMLGNGANALSAVAPGTSGNVLSSNGTTWVSAAAPAAGATLSDDTATNTTQYIGMSRITSGSWTSAYVSSAGLTFNPSSGTLSATVFNSTSDKRAKENIRPIGYNLETVKQLVGKKFEMKDSGLTSIGLIAQDVQKIIPEVVSETDSSTGMLGINYPVLVSVLIEAIKELNERIVILESK